jgi:glycosyltransferase involved in cell wall biosynthesis
MRAAINTIVFPPETRIGVGVYVENLLHQIVQTFPDHQFEALVNERQPGFLGSAANLKVTTCKIEPSPSWKHIFWQPALNELLLRSLVDVYHLPNTGPLLIRQCATVATINDLQELHIDKYGMVRGAYRRLANRFMARNATCVITLSESSKRDIVSAFGVPAERVHVVYLAASSQFVMLERQVAAAHVRDKYGYASYCLCVGDIQRGKNLVRLVEAYDSFLKSGGDLDLVLVGAERAPYDELHKRILELKLQDRVHFPGYVPFEDLLALYRDAIFSVFPSLYEGFGLPVLEAFQSGTPLAASNTSSIPEVAGDAALLFDPLNVEAIASVMLQLHHNASLRAHLVERGLEQAKRFSWRKCAEQTMQVYEEARQRFIARNQG